MKLQGKVWKYGDNVDTDVIIPARHTNTHDPRDLAKHCLEDLDIEFAGKVRPGDIIVAGANFGCGSSREHAPIAIKGAGIATIIAVSFARIFYRNSFNMGLPLFECAAAAGDIRDGETIEIDLDTGLITNLTRNKTYQAEPVPAFMQNLLDAGGLIPFIQQEMEREGQNRKE